jgi:Ca-activated chloride channel family protein
MRFGAKSWLNHRQPAHTLGIFSVARLGLTLLAVALPAAAQTEKPTALTPGATPTLKIQSNLVAVSAIVRDAAGKPVSGLTLADFLLKQDGKPQPITYFSQASQQGSSLPLTVALMVDTRSRRPLQPGQL